MYRPNWKVAVAGGSIAALGLGGFAAAQTGGDSSTDAPDGIRLQRDAVRIARSLVSRSRRWIQGIRPRVVVGYVVLMLVALVAAKLVVRQILHRYHS